MPTQPSAPIRDAPTSRGRFGPRRPPALWLGLALLVIVIAVIAIVASSHSDSTKKTAVVTGNGKKSTVALHEVQPVTITGKALPSLGNGTDTAIGLTAPQLRGKSFDGTPVTVTHDGRPKLVLFVAHWCPHCQREVPLLVRYLGTHPLPAGIDMVAIATSTSANDPNYPPSAWLTKEHWPTKVMADSSGFAAAQAFGLPAFPYFVALDSHGKVVGRTTGEITTGQFAQLLTAAMKS